MRVIGETGEQLGIMSSFDANRLAEDKGLDLVKIAPQGNPPVCKIMDYGKYKFELSKKAKEAKKNQKFTELKEMWLSMTIEQHDLETKARITSKFLQDGDKVKVSIRMRGRQQAHPQIGVDIMNKFFAILEPDCVMEKAPLKEGRSILMILAPKKSKDK